jgi:hypothetical protein
MEAIDMGRDFSSLPIVVFTFDLVEPWAQCLAKFS